MFSSFIKSFKLPPGFLQEPISENIFVCMANQSLSYIVYLYSEFNTMLPVPLSTKIPTPLKFTLLSKAKGAKGVS